MLKKLFNVFRIYEWIFVIISFLLLIILGIVFKANALEIISVLLGLLSATLNGKRKKYAFFFYSVFVILYGTMAFINKQYGEGILNLCINLPLYLYTLYKFYLKDRKNDNKEEKNKGFKISGINKYLVIGIIIFIPLVTGLYGYILSIFSSKLPYLNALATAFAIVAVVLASKTSIYQWIFWILYSVVLTIIWSLNYFIDNSGGLLYLVLNLVYIIVNIYCFVQWIFIKKKQNIAV